MRQASWRRECRRKGLENGGGGRLASIDAHRARLPFHARDDARVDDRVRRPRLDPAPPLRPLDARPGIAPAAALALAGAGALAFLPAAHREVVDVEARAIGLVLGLEVGLADVRARSRIAAGVADERRRAVFQPAARRRALDAGLDPGPGLAARIAAAAVAAHEPRGRLEIGVVAPRLVEAVDGPGGRREKDEHEEEPGAAHGVSPRVQEQKSGTIPARRIEACGSPRRSHEQALLLVVEAVVHPGDVFAVAVVEERRARLVGAEDLLGRLAPARMRHLRVDVRPEAVLVCRKRLPEALRPLVREGEPDERLRRFEAVLPRHGEAQRGAELVRERLAVDAADEEAQLVCGLLHRQTLDIGPRIPDLPLAWRHRLVEEGLHAQVARRGERLRDIEEGRHLEAGPGHRHRPGLDAAMAVEPLLDRHLADEVVDADVERLLDHAVDLHGPGPGLQRPGRGGDALRGAELVEVVVVAGELLRRDRPIERVGLVPFRRIEVERRIGALGERRAPPKREPAGVGSAAREKRPAVDEHRFGRRLRFRDLPPAPLLDPHHSILRDAPEGVATRRHAQVTPWRGLAVSVARAPPHRAAHAVAASSDRRCTGLRALPREARTGKVSAAAPPPRADERPRPPRRGRFVSPQPLRCPRTSSRSTRRRTLPSLVLGRLSRNSMTRGILYAVRFSRAWARMSSAVTFGSFLTI